MEVVHVWLFCFLCATASFVLSINFICLSFLSHFFVVVVVVVVAVVLFVFIYSFALDLDF